MWKVVKGDVTESGQIRVMTYESGEAIKADKELAERVARLLNAEDEEVLKWLEATGWTPDEIEAHKSANEGVGPPVRGIDDYDPSLAGYVRRLYTDHGDSDRSRVVGPGIDPYTRAVARGRSETPERESFLRWAGKVTDELDAID